MTARLHGREAIEYAGTHGLTLSKYADPIEDAREGLSIEEAEEVLSEDPGLIYVEMTTPEPPTADEIRAWRSRMGWTQEQASRALGLSRGHLADLETDARNARGYLRLAMERLEDVHG
jgi:DNA-binding XRE family transcriptional regulator